MSTHPLIDMIDGHQGQVYHQLKWEDQEYLPTITCFDTVTFFFFFLPLSILLVYIISIIVNLDLIKYFLIIIKISA